MIDLSVHGPGERAHKHKQRAGRVRSRASRLWPAGVTPSGSLARFGTRWQEAPGPPLSNTHTHTRQTCTNKHSLMLRAHMHALTYTHSCWLAGMPQFSDKLTEGLPAFTPTQLQEPNRPSAPSISAAESISTYVSPPALSVCKRRKELFFRPRCINALYRKLFTVQNECRAVSSQNSIPASLYRALVLRRFHPCSSTLASCTTHNSLYV